MSGAFQRVVSIALRGGVAAFALALCIHGSTKHPARIAALPSAAQSAAPAEITDEDIARGWRLVSVTTNAALSYVMPPEGRTCGKWHLRGAYEDVTVVDFGDWRFPVGTNATSRMWAFVWGRMRPALRDKVHEIRAVDAPMSAIPSVSRLWTAATAESGRLVTWERFVLGRLRIGEPLTAERTVNAQIELLPDGGFVTRSNEVERTYARIDPDDWDGDGWHNADDSAPRAWTGGEFGLLQSLPSGANASAYCWVELVADYNTRVAFAGDGPSDLEDPAFTARAGETNRVTLLIGKTYTVTASRPLRVVERSSRQISVKGDGTASLTIRYPVTVRAAPARGGGFAMSVVPSGLGGAFAWTRTCCPLTGLGDDFWYVCTGLCACGGCAAEGTYTYEGYALPCTGGRCACPVGTDGPWTEPDEGPCEVSASVAFSAPAVIFEDAYTNRPGEAVARRSTKTVLSCTAHGGERGAEVSFALDGAERLARVSGTPLPLTRFVPPGQKLAFETTYEGLLPSDAEGDVVSRAVCETDDGGESAATNSAALTAVKVELAAVYEAPENPCTNRHVYGVGEKVRLSHYPSGVSAEWHVEWTDVFSELEDGAGFDKMLTLHYLGEPIPEISVQFNGVKYRPSLSLVEPQYVVAKRQEWDGECIEKGLAGGAGMYLWLYIGPMHVSFQGIDVSEIPCGTVVPPTGYYATTNFKGVLSHTLKTGAGYWLHVQKGNYWSKDHARLNERKPAWSDGRMVWNIPMQWYKRFDMSLSWPRGMTHADGRLIGGSEGAYRQEFEITAAGTVRVTKHGNWVELTTNDLIRLNGAVIHTGNH